jgi:uncharacterized protein (TIGR02996 family)
VVWGIDELASTPLAKRLIANPDDRRSQLLFADWLQSQGDPWGELIVLAHAGRNLQAQKVLQDHAHELIGEQLPRLFEWRDGFIHTVKFDGAPRKPPQVPREILELRTTLLTRRIVIPGLPDDAVVSLVSQRAPRALDTVTCSFSNSIARFEIPTLENLELSYFAHAPLDLTKLRPLFDATRFNVTSFVFFGLSIALPHEVIAALIHSRLMRQLEVLALMVDESGAGLLLANADKLAHLRRAKFYAPAPFEALLKEAYKSQYKGWERRYPSSTDED